MNQHKIAVVVDSCTDVPTHLVKEFGMYVVPLKVIYRDNEFYDGIDITADEVYEGMKQETPKTSLPSGEVVMKIFDQIIADGYQQVVVITISSGLSGTNNLMSLIAQQYESLDVCVIDTKNIGIGAGFSGIYTAELVQQGLSFADVCAKVQANLANSKLYFCVATLEYLQKGGRIGLVASLLGNVLDLKPIITCNDDGIYYTVAKVRGRKQSLSKALDLAVEFAKGHPRYKIAISNALAQEEAEEIKQRIQKLLPDSVMLIEGAVSPALGVHCGPGSIGIAIQVLD